MMAPSSPRGIEADGTARGRLFRSLVSNDVLRQVSHTLASRVALVVVGLTTSVLVSRALGPDGRGRYIIAVSIGSIGVQLGNLGLQSANTYFVARDRSRLSSLLGNSVVLALGGGAVAAVAAGALFALRPSIAPVKGLLLYAALTTIPFGLCALFFQNLLIGIDRVRTTNRIDVLTRLGGVGLTIVVIAAGWVSSLSMFLVGAVALITSVLWAWVALRARVDGAISASWTLFRETFGYGRKIYLAAFFAFMVIRSDLFVVSYLRGARETGLYSIAVALADFVLLVPTVVGTVVFPKIVALPNSEDRWKLAFRATLLVALALLCGAVVSIGVVGPGIRGLYGAEFAPARSLFLWLLPGVVCLGAETVLVQYLASEGFPTVVVWGWAGAFVANVILTVILVGRLGAMGASIASSVSYAAMLVFVASITLKFRVHARAN